jgi:hypothetical protein
MASDERLDIKKFDFVEPGFVFLDPKGKVVHVVDRVRTFNAPWMIHLLRAVLAKHPKFNRPVGDDADSLARGGDYEAALKKTKDPVKRARLRRLLREPAEAAAELEGQKGTAAAVERAWLALHKSEFAAAENALAGVESREAEYLLSLIEFYTARESAAIGRWKKLAGEDDRWGWKSAANLVTERDTLPMGPTLHSFEDPFWYPSGAYADLPEGTRWPREEKEIRDVARRAVEFLLRNQRANGGFEDSRYVYCPSPKILPNVFVAATSLAAAALLQWREIDPERIDKALKKAEAYLLDDRNMNRGRNEEMYADAYRLVYWTRKYDAIAAERKATLREMTRIVKALSRTQRRNGFWAHEYPNPFCTAAVMHGLWMARERKAEGVDPLLKRGASALKSTRGRNGRQAYGGRGRASGAKDSCARSAMCEAALHMAGEASRGDIRKALSEFWEHHDKLEWVRVCDYHAHGQLGGFFYFHGFFHSAVAASLLDKKDRGEQFSRFRDQLLRIPEIDGSFIDSHELGKCYGTAMALLVLRLVEE